MKIHKGRQMPEALHEKVACGLLRVLPDLKRAEAARLFEREFGEELSPAAWKRAKERARGGLL